MSKPLSAAPSVPLLPELSRAERVDAVYLKHHKMVYGTALTYGGGNHAWAEDVTQDVFFVLLEKIDSLPDRGNLGPWLRRVTINRCISALRRRAVRESPLVRWIVGEKQKGGADLERDLEVSQDLQRVWAALDGLSAKARVVFCMRHFDGESQRDIAAALGHSPGYVSKLLARAQEHLRQRMGGEWRDIG